MSDYKLCPLTAVLKAAEEVSQQGDPMAVGAFNVNFYTQAEGVLEGLRRTDAPTIIQASKGANKFQGGPDKIFYMVTKAMETIDHKRPVVLHLDHGNPEKGEQCADSGYTGIMIDASDQEFPMNVAITRGMVAYAHPRGVGVEGEYGQLSGVEEDIEVQETVYADPDQVPRFFKETGADALAVAYGTSHGPNKGTNIDALKTEIVRQSYENLVDENMNDECFLVGHGSSTVPQEIVQEINELGGDLQGAQGVPLEKIKEGIAYGLRKINIDTDLRLGITATTRKFFKDNPSAAKCDALKGAKKVLDEQLDVIDPRDYLGEVKPFDILRDPPEESGIQEFVDLMALIKERIAGHVEFLVNEFGCAGKAGNVESVSQDEMKKIYSEKDPW